MKKKLSTWGQQCKIQMLVLGKTLEDLSTATQLSRTYISAIINGRIIVPEETIQKISNELDVNVNLYKEESNINSVKGEI